MLVILLGIRDWECLICDSITIFREVECSEKDDKIFICKVIIFSEFVAIFYEIEEVPYSRENAFPSSIWLQCHQHPTSSQEKWEKIWWWEIHQACCVLIHSDCIMFRVLKAWKSNYKRTGCSLNQILMIIFVSFFLWMSHVFA